SCRRIDLARYGNGRSSGNNRRLPLRVVKVRLFPTSLLQSPVVHFPVVNIRSKDRRSAGPPFLVRCDRIVSAVGVFKFQLSNETIRRSKEMHSDPCQTTPIPPVP